MVTATQLQNALQTTSQLNEALVQLREIIEVALRGTVASVALDATVLNALQTQYTTIKAQLVTLFNQLP